MMTEDFENNEINNGVLVEVTNQSSPNGKRGWFLAISYVLCLTYLLERALKDSM